MQGGKQATAKQKRWHNHIVSKGCSVCGMPANLHHCVGSSAKHRKTWIGQDFVIPLCYEHHQGKGGIHGDLSSITGFNSLFSHMTRKQIEKTLFKRQDFDHPDAPDKEVINVIMDYHL